MAVRQYVGARYVPKFWDNGSGSTEWMPNIPYESLVVVTYMNNSYTSKVPVPATQIAPNVDTEHWALTGAYNAQVEQYRQEVVKLEQNVNSLRVNVKDFGAVGDGVTDDTEVFNSVFASGNKTIIIPEGKYKISDTINIDSNTTVICTGTIMHTITGENYKSTFSANGKTNISLMGIRMDGTGAVNGALNYSCCMLFTNCTNVKITNCSFYDIQSAYCVLFRKCDNVTIKGCIIKEYSYSGISNMFSENLYVIENSVINCVNSTYVNSYPISLNGYDTEIPVGTPMPKNLNAIGNYVYNTIPWWEGISWHGGNGVTAVNNKIVGTLTGIASLDDTSKNFTSKNVVICDNYVELGTDKTFARLVNNSCLTLSGDNVVACNNVLLNGGIVTGSHESVNACSGLYVVDLTNAIIANNTISNIYGNIFDIRGCDNITIKNNLINDITAKLARGLRYLYTFHYSNNNKTIIISDNIVKNGKDFIDVETNDNNTASGYIKITGDTYDESITVAGITNIIKPLTNVSRLTMGHINDVVMKYPAATGTPIGWVCTTNWVNGANGTWTPLPNI